MDFPPSLKIMKQLHGMKFFYDVMGIVGRPISDEED
jgi:hypothetical protein